MQQSLGGLAIIGSIITSLIDKKRHKEYLQNGKENWHREKIMEAYSGAVYYLVNLGISSLDNNVTSDKDTRQYYCESQRFLNLLRIYHYNQANIEKLEDCSRSLFKVYDQTIKFSDAADKAVEQVKNIAKEDPIIIVRLELMQVPKVK